MDLEATIKTELSQFWDERAVPAGPEDATSVDELVGPVESMTAVDVLVSLDALVGFKLPNSVIQAGGYQTKADFVEKLSAKVMAQVAKQAKS